MREIKFRGKVADCNEWVYGYLGMNTNKEPAIMQYEESKGRCGFGNFVVKEDTVGQFTGLYDKNGREIYEGDVIDVWNFVGVVEYINGSFTFGADCTLCSLTGKLKVVGNIYDNPELVGD